MIEARGLVKRYGSTAAVNDLSFTIRPGLVTGFLGPNGAGKPVTRLRRSWPLGGGRWTSRRSASASAAVRDPRRPPGMLPAGLAVIGRRRCVAQPLPSDTDMTWRDGVAWCGQ
jgi:ABC-type phosphate/phosphonate transport system ATPase subunit